MTETPSPRRRWIAILGGIVAALLLAEVGLRLGGVEPARHAPPRWEVWESGEFRLSNLWGGGRTRRPSSFERLGVYMGEYVPGSKFRIVFDSNPRGYFEEDGGVTMAVNSLGLRGEEISRKKPPLMTRVLALGDSFTFGVGVRDEDTFVRRVETEFSLEPSMGRTVEVLNAGTQGYNTHDEILYLEHRWMALDPDVVLIVFYLNDAYSDGAFWNMGQGIGADLAQPEGVARVSRVYDLMQHGWRARDARRRMDEHYAAQYFQGGRDALESADDKDAHWNVSRKALARAKQLCDERGVRLGLVIFPELHALDGDYPFEAVHQLVTEECASLGIPVRDLLPAFRGQDARELWVHPSDHHPNEMAHGLAAQPIHRFLADELGVGQ